MCEWEKKLGGEKRVTPLTVHRASHQRSCRRMISPSVGAAGGREREERIVTPPGPPGKSQANRGSTIEPETTNYQPSGKGALRTYQSKQKEELPSNTKHAASSLQNSPAPSRSLDETHFCFGGGEGASSKVTGRELLRVSYTSL